MSVVSACLSPSSYSYEPAVHNYTKRSVYACGGFLRVLLFFILEFLQEGEQQKQTLLSKRLHPARKHTQLTCVYVIRHTRQYTQARVCVCARADARVCVGYLTGLLLREIRRDSRQLSSCVSLGSVLNSWMYITADLELSFWLWPCTRTQTVFKWYFRLV